MQTPAIGLFEKAQHEQRIVVKNSDASEDDAFEDDLEDAGDDTTAPDESDNEKA